MVFNMNLQGLKPVVVCISEHKYRIINTEGVGLVQGCIICAILPSEMGARGVSSEHVENMAMFSCSPT